MIRPRYSRHLARATGQPGRGSLRARALAHAAGLAAAATSAAPAHAADDAQVWATVAAEVRLDPDTALTLDAISRSRPDSIDTGQIIARIGVRQTIATDTSVQLTYGWFHNLIDGGPNTTEHRFGETLATQLGTAGRWRFDARLGLEQRLQDSGGEVGWRGRERLRASYRLSQSLDAQFSEELIVAANDTAWGQRSGLSVSRLGSALHWRITPQVGIAPGYTWQHVFRRPGDDRDDHLIQMTVDLHF